MFMGSARPRKLILFATNLNLLIWRGKCYLSFGTGKSAGVAVLLPPHFSGSVQCFLFDSDGCVLSLLFTFGPSS